MAVDNTELTYRYYYYLSRMYSGQSDEWDKLFEKWDAYFNTFSTDEMDTIPTAVRAFYNEYKVRKR